MLQYFLNPWLLAGVIGIALPIIAHLLNRRRFDVVEWAAMQFLKPARKTRRRLRLEELLLLSLRIGMILLLVLAAARPWIPGGLLSGYRSAGSRSVVIVIDGSNSMARSDGLNTLHQNAVRRASEFLKSLGGGDSVALIDARDQPRTILESPLQDLEVVQQALQRLAGPGGAADLQKAAERAVAILGRSSSASREIVVFTDRQRNSWNPDNESAWQRFEDLLTFPSVRPRLWTIDVAKQLVALPRNIAVDRLMLMRDLTVPDFPLRMSSLIRNSGTTALQVPVRLLLNGQPLTGKQQNVDVPAGGQAAVEFELLIRPEGTHLLSIEAIVADDPIPADNVSHAAVRVTSALPVLLINGRRTVNIADRETFFAGIALTTPGNQTPWVQARTVDAAEVRADDLKTAAMVVLADVDRLDPKVIEELVSYASQGNGVFITLGPNTSPESFQKLYTESGLVQGIELLRSKQAPLDAADSVRIAPLSMMPGWLDRFASPSRSFLKSQFQQWWLTRLSGPLAGAEPARSGVANSPDAEPSNRAIDVPNSSSQQDGAAGTAAKIKQNVQPQKKPSVQAPVILAQFTTGDACLLQTQCGKGSVMVMTSTLSRLWNDLPTKADYVPFLHEAIFQAAATRTRRNVDFGTPLIGSPRDVQSDDELQKAGFTDPSGVFLEPSAIIRGDTPELVLTDTFLPGVYELVRGAGDGGTEPEAGGARLTQRTDRFVVNYDHREDDMTELSADDRAKMMVNDRVRFADSLQDLQLRMYGNESQTELWAALMLLFPCLLVAEVLLTRRIVQRGHGENESPAA